MRSVNLIDLPLAGYDSEEPLGLSTYADALTNFITHCQTPITIGIQGDWGIGKTSLLNMVRDRLGPQAYRREEYPSVYFNTWQYAQLDREEHLTIALLADLVRRIGALDAAPAESRKQARDLLGKVSRMAASAGTQVLLNKVGIDGAEVLRAAEESDDLPTYLQTMQLVVGYKHEFQRLVETFMEGKKSGSRLVVMIDDLDRIRPARALELLSAVKNFLDVPRCVFVLAVDYAVIQRGVAEKMGTAERMRHGKSYFDKIIQVPFNMPVASYRVDRYILSLLGWGFDDAKGHYKRLPGGSGVNPANYFKNHQTVGKGVARDIENITRLTVGKNPRSIKRAVNYFSLLKLVFEANGGTDTAEGRGIGRWQDLYLRLLYAFSCFQLAYPELFTLFTQDPTPQTLRRLEDFDVLSRLPQMRRIGERVDDADEVKSHIAGFFDQIVSIIDRDGDGDISAEEFRPIWDVIRHANLTSVSFFEADGAWGAGRSAGAPLRRGLE